MAEAIHLLRHAGGRIGHLYFTVRQNDHVVLGRLLAEGRLQANGLLLDARRNRTQQGLRRDAARNGIVTWLDTQAMELALPSGVTKGHAMLPWANSPKKCDELGGMQQKAIARTIADFAVSEGYQGVLAPCHYLNDEAGEWIEKDAESTQLLRDQLDTLGGSNIRVSYPLAISTRLLNEVAFRDRIVRSLRNLPIDSISLRIHPFGARSGPNAVRNTVESILQLRQSGHRLMIERAGFTGFALFAIGAVDAVESGVAIGDTFDVGNRLRSGGASDSVPNRARVYLESLGMTVELRVAEELLNAPHGKSRFACKDTRCCPNGARDMLRDPRRHSVLARQREFLALSQMPVRDRGLLFVQRFMTPACDMLFRAGDHVTTFKDTHRRVLSIKETLSALLEEQEAIRLRRLSQSVRPARSSAEIISLPPRDPVGR